MKKTITVSASVSGWYKLKFECDEGRVIQNIRLEADQPVTVRFDHDRPSTPQKTSKSWHKPRGDRRQK